MLSRITRETFLALRGPIQVSRDSARHCALELHSLDMRHTGNPYHRVGMDQAVRDSRIHDPPPDKIQDIRTYHQRHRLSNAYDRTAVELRLRCKSQAAFPESTAYTVLVAARHHNSLLSLVRGCVDETQ